MRARWGFGALALLVGAGLGVHAVDSGASPRESLGRRVDVGFATDMSAHHEQAILLADLVGARSRTPIVRAFAHQVEVQQGEQLEEMSALLRSWHRPAEHGDMVMAAMSHEPSAGMASPAEIDRLRASSGRDADVLFVQLMLRHHQGGLPMMRVAAENAVTARIRSLAQVMLFHQSQEIVYLLQSLRARGAHPLPAPSQAAPTW